MPEVQRDLPLVVWDVDDVLNDLTAQWAEYAGVTLSSHEAPTGDPGSWVCHQGVGYDEYIKSLDAFRARSYGSLSPNPSAVSLLAEWSGPLVVHIAMTATPLSAQSVVASWVMAHFGTWIRGVWFCPSRRTDDPPYINYESKGQALARFRGRALLIDDSQSNLDSLGHAQRGLLFPRPWNIARESDDISAKQVQDELSVLQAQREDP